jgi:cysteine-rich repeat protein
MACTANGACLSEQRVRNCDGLDDGSACAFDDIDGVCIAGGCYAGACGDGITTPPEICDDGNVESGDGCNAGCSSTEACGNGIVDPGEECDCGEAVPAPGCADINSDASGAACRSDCVLHCGDGVVNAAEQCDLDVGGAMSCLELGFDYGALACDATCSFDFAGCAQIAFEEFQWGVSRNATSVWVSPSGKMYAASGDRIVERVGDDWVRRIGVVGAIQDLWGIGDDNVWAVGSLFSFNIVIQFDGNEWTVTGVPVPASANAIWGRSSGEIFAAGATGEVARIDDLNNIVPLPSLPDVKLIALSGTSAFLAASAEDGIWHFAALGDRLVLLDINGSIAEIYPQTP